MITRYKLTAEQIAWNERKTDLHWKAAVKAKPHWNKQAAYSRKEGLRLGFAAEMAFVSMIGGDAQQLWVLPTFPKEGEPSPPPKPDYVLPCGLAVDVKCTRGQFAGISAPYWQAQEVWDLYVGLQEVTDFEFKWLGWIEGKEFICKQWWRPEGQGENKAPYYSLPRRLLKDPFEFDRWQ